MVYEQPEMGRTGEKRGLSDLDKNSLHLKQIRLTRAKALQTVRGFPTETRRGYAASIKYVYPGKGIKYDLN